MDATVYEIARWSQVFETSESRKYKSLPWISERVNFDSTGWQQGLERFGPAEWPAVYGCWMIVCRTAATSKYRGRLCGDKGEPWTAFRIARPAGVDPAGIQRAIDFAVEIGWLVAVEHTEDDSTDKSPDDLPTCREKIIATERNGTERNLNRAGERRADPGRVLDCWKIAMQARAAKRGKPLPEQLLTAIEPSDGPSKPRQCWTAASGWDDRIIVQELTDPHQRSVGRKNLWTWYRRQLAAPDPAVSDNSGAAAVAVLALAEEAATRPGLKSRVAWFRSAVSGSLKGKPPAELITELDQKTMTNAAKFVIEATAN